MDRPDRCDLAPPLDVIQAARSTMGAVDLDPYGSAQNNELVIAARYYDRDTEDFNMVIARDWDCPGEGRVFIGPPAGAGATRRLLNKCLREYRAGRIQQAVIWVAHNETLIRAPWVWDFPICIPFRRLRPCYWDDELEEWRTISPSDWSAIVYLPPASPPEAFYTKLSRFHVSFNAIGRIVFDANSGEDEWVRPYEVLTGKPYNYRE